MEPVTPSRRDTPVDESQETPVVDRALADDTVSTLTPRVDVVDGDEDLAGTMLGEYRVEGIIGRGGMGTVYSAVHPVIGKRAAVKILKPELCRKTFEIARFIDEARVVNQIGHPNIVDVFAFGQTPKGCSYFVMEWLKGETLRARIERSRLELDDIRDIVQPLTSALVAAHEQGVIHRDLKPDNVFLFEVRGESPRVKLLDFGIAKLAHEGHRLERTATGAIVGTPQYIAPEQAKGYAIDERVDVYSLGAMLFELFTGRPPFIADNAMEMVAKHLMEEPPRPSLFASVLPELDDLMLAMLAKDPSARPSMVEVGAWFERTNALDRTNVRTQLPALASVVAHHSSKTVVAPPRVAPPRVAPPRAKVPSETVTVLETETVLDPALTSELAESIRPRTRPARSTVIALAVGIVVAGVVTFSTVNHLVGSAGTDREAADSAAGARELGPVDETGPTDETMVPTEATPKEAAPTPPVAGTVPTMTEIDLAPMIVVTPPPSKPNVAASPPPTKATPTPSTTKPAPAKLTPSPPPRAAPVVTRVEPKRPPIEKKRPPPVENKKPAVVQPEVKRPAVVQPEVKRPLPDPKLQKRRLQLRIEGATNYTILIDGKPQGLSTELSPGTHRIAVRADGMQPYTATIDVKTENITWPVKLIKVPPARSDRDLLPKGSVK